MSIKKLTEAKSIVTPEVADWLTIGRITRTAQVTTASDVADMVEYAINEAKPAIRTKRGAGTLIELKVGRRKFLVSVVRPVRRKGKSE